MMSEGNLRNVIYIRYFQLRIRNKLITFATCKLF